MDQRVDALRQLGRPAAHTQSATDRRAVYRRGAWWHLAAAALCAILLAPLLITDVPPLVDYPNHLARSFVLAALAGDPVLARFYAPHWALIPNLALDLLAWPLLHVLPVHVAGRALIALAVVLPTLGTFVFHAAVNPGPRWWALGVGFIAWNSLLLYGFLNFEIALGLALLFAALWLRWRPHRAGAAVISAAAGAVLLFTCHLMGLVFFAALLTGAEIARITRHPRPFIAARPAIAALLAVFAPPAILYNLTDLHALGDNAVYQPAGAKLAQLLTIFANYDPLLDTTTAVVLIGGAALALWFRQGRVPAPAAWSGLILAALFLAAPFAFKGTFFLDTRLTAMLGLLLFAGFVPGRWPSALSCPVAAVLVLLFAARMALLACAWSAHGADLADLRAVLAEVQPGQSLYVVEAGFDEAPAYWSANPRWRRLSATERSDEHLAALTVIEHRAWWPFLFDNPSQQPIETREPYRSRAEAIGHMPHYADLRRGVPCGFDYLLLQGADAVPDLPGEQFRLVRRAGFAALYAMKQCRMP